MYITLQQPDNNSKNTEPYIMFYSGIKDDKEWVYKQFPWTPSSLDLFSNSWRIKEDIGGQ